MHARVAELSIRQMGHCLRTEREGDREREREKEEEEGWMSGWIVGSIDNNGLASIIFTALNSYTRVPCCCSPRSQDPALPLRTVGGARSIDPCVCVCFPKGGMDIVAFRGTLALVPDLTSALL